MNNTILKVAMNGLLVGEWRKLANGATEFQYPPKWLDSACSRPISLSLPLSHKVYRGIRFTISSIIFCPTMNKFVHAFNNVSRPRPNPPLICFRLLSRIALGRFNFITVKVALFGKFMRNR